MKIEPRQQSSENTQNFLPIMDIQTTQEKGMQPLYRDGIDQRLIQVERAKVAERAFADEYYQPAAIAERLRQWRKRFYKGESHRREFFLFLG